MLGPDRSGKPEVLAGRRGEMVLDVLLEDDCDDFRFIATGLFFVLADRGLFARFGFETVSGLGRMVSWLLTLCSVEEGSVVLGAIVPLSVLSVVGRAVRFSKDFWAVLPTGVVEGVLSSSSSSAMKLGVEM